MTTDVEAKSKRKKSSRKKISKIRKQSLQESLKKLEEYLPAYDVENHKFDNVQIRNIEFAHQSLFENDNLKLKLINNINDWLQTPYRRGGRSKNGIDCSNFTSMIVNLTFGVNFPSSPGAQTQSSHVEIIKNIDDLQFGDLIFFSGRNRNSKRIGHVGFYLGNGLFAHSSTGRGVIYTHISESYYTPRYRFGGRLSFTITEPLQAQVEK